MSNAKKLYELRKKQGRDTSGKSFLIYDKNAKFESYYDSFLSEEDIQKSVREYRGNLDRIDKEFSEKTGLNHVDMGFLVTATALQCIRQYFLTPFRERVDDQTAANSTKGKDKEHSDRVHKYYKPSLEEVISNPVPFDANIGAQGSLKGAGKLGHRGATPGHDPLLGYIFGTANIATSTLTNYKMESFHIKTAAGKDVFKEHANTIKVFEEVFNKLKSDDPRYGRIVVGASLVKEFIHLKSDIGSKNSLPLPIIGTLNPSMASKLAEYGFDAANMVDFGKQVSLSILINTIIAMIHGLYGSFIEKPNPEEHKLFEVRTRKILLYSNLIASSSNLIYSILSEDWRHFDLGGLAVTLYRIFSDTKFIHNVRVEFLNSTVSKIYEEKFKEIEFYYS